MNKLLFVALTAFTAAAHAAQPSTQSLELKNASVLTTGVSGITAPNGQTTDLVNTAGAVSTSTVKAPAAPAVAEVLSLQTLKEGDVQVDLPTVRNADGSICVSYVSDASGEHDEKLKPDTVTTVTVKRICGMPATAGGTTPAKLLSLQVFESKGLAVQLLNVAVR